MNFSKYFLVITLSTTALFSCKKTSSEPNLDTKSEIQTTAPKKIAANAKLETTSFNIEGMTCAIGCAKTIEKELSSLDGVKNATVDFDNKKATIEFDANIQSPESLAKVVEATGDGVTYKVTNLKS